MRTFRKLKGFSLIEILMTMSLMGVLLTIGFMQTNRWRGRSSCRGEAQVVAEMIRGIREKAIKDQVPVALAMPSANGTQPFAQSLYVLSGMTSPKVTNVINLQSDYPDSYLFQGYWAVDPAALRDPGKDNSTSEPPSGLSRNGFDPAVWGMPTPTDYALIFLPTGAVVSNGLTNFDGDYHLLVCQSFAASQAATPPGPGGSTSYFNLTGATEPYTIRITPTGQVEVVTGILAGSGLQSQGAALAAVPAPAQRSNAANNPPVVKSGDVSVTPTYDPSLLTGGASWGCSIDGQMTIAIKATDSDGDQLFCKWSPKTGGIHSATDGQFSTSAVEWQPMLFRNGFWEARCSWRPPDSAAAGQVFNLDCQVNDMRGGIVNVGGGVVTVMKAEIRNASTIWACDAQSVYKINSDGLIVQEIALPTSLGGLCNLGVSRNGSHIIGASNGNKLLQWNADGTLLKTFPHLSTAANECDPDIGIGGRLSFWASGTIWTANNDGTDAHQVTFPVLQQDNAPIWSADGKKLTFIRNSNSATDFQVMVLDVNTNSLATLCPGWGAAWSPDDSTICLRRADGVYSVPSNGSNPPTRLVNVGSSSSPTWFHSVSWTSDGSKLVYLDANDEPRICNPDGSADKPLMNPPIKLRAVRPSW